MKFKIEQQELAKALTSICRITAKSAKKTVLENVHIVKLDNNKIRLEAFNGITILQYDLIAESVEGEEILFNANYLLSIVSRLNGIIQFDNGNIKSGKCKFKIPYVNEEYPTLEYNYNDDFIEIETKDFINAIAKTINTTSNAGNGVLSGIYINKNEMVSTDSNRLTLIKLNKELSSFILPKELCENITKLFESENIKLYISDKQIIIKNDNIAIANASVIGNYPKYEAILPKDFNYEIKLKKSDLANSLNVLMPVLQQSPSMLCTLKFEDNICKVSAFSNSSESSIDFELEETIEKDFEISFNGQFLLDMLKNNGEDITFKVISELSPATFESEDIYTLIMPIRKNKI